MAYQKLTPIIATGSTAPRYLGDRFADIVNLKDFGAVGDGETDDSTAWAAWQTALQGGGLPIAPAGDYLLDDSVVHIPNGRIGGSFNAQSYDDAGDVWDLFSNPVYVDSANGDDSNTGMTEEDSVSTVSRAIEILKSAPSNCLQKIIISSGTYAENITISSQKVNIKLTGNITINGKTSVDNSYVLVDNNGYTFTVDGQDNDCAILVTSGGVLDVGSMSVAGNKQGINVYRNSELTVSNSLTISTAETCLLAEDHCSVFLSGTNTINGPQTSYDAILVNRLSFLSISGTTTYTHRNTSGGAFLTSTYMSCVFFSGNAVLSGDKSYCFRCTYHSFFNIVSGTITINGGHSSQTITCTNNSHFHIAGTSDVTLNGDATGRRFSVYTHSYINVNGAGANRIPGNNTGNIDTTTYSYYG